MCFKTFNLFVQLSHVSLLVVVFYHPSGGAAAPSASSALYYEINSVWPLCPEMIQSVYGLNSLFSVVVLLQA